MTVHIDKPYFNDTSFKRDLFSTLLQETLFQTKSFSGARIACDECESQCIVQEACAGGGKESERVRARRVRTAASPRRWRSSSCRAVRQSPSGTRPRRARRPQCAPRLRARAPSESPTESRVLVC